MIAIPLICPMVMYLSSYSECASSKNSIRFSSWKTCAAVLKSIPCLAILIFSLSSFHSKSICIISRPLIVYANETQNAIQKRIRTILSFVCKSNFQSGVEVTFANHKKQKDGESISLSPSFSCSNLWGRNPVIRPSVRQHRWYGCRQRRERDRNLCP